MLRAERLEPQRETDDVGYRRGEPGGARKRTIPTLVPGSSSHGTPQRLYVDPVRLTTAWATIPRGWIGLP